MKVIGMIKMNVQRKNRLYISDNEVEDMGTGTSSAPGPQAAPLVAPSVPEAGSTSTTSGGAHSSSRAPYPASDDETASNVTVTDLMAPEVMEELLGTDAIEDDAEAGEAVLA